MYAPQKCGRFDAYLFVCLYDKPEVEVGFLTCANSDVCSFQAMATTFSTYRHKILSRAKTK